MNQYKKETITLHSDYNAADYFGAVKMPRFNTSTFKFESAEEGKLFFEYAYGLKEKPVTSTNSLIYSRIDNPNMSLFEKRMARLDDMEESAVFASGMAAISSTLMAMLKPGDTILFSEPVYGGTHHFIKHILTAYGINVIGFKANESYSDLNTKLSGHEGILSMIFMESPTNPTNDVFDIEMCRSIANEYSTDNKKVVLCCDNTYMGPVWSQVKNLGADLVLYSATKYLGGHSDLIAGVVSGSSELITQVKAMRSFYGGIPSPDTCQMLTRSLETLFIRVERQTENAIKIAKFLSNEHLVEDLIFPGECKGSVEFNQELFDKQFKGAGSMISMRIKGGEKESFKFLNHLKVFQLAVSLGSTESLAQHPFSMTHAGIDIEEKNKMGVTENLIRLSVGIENVEDLIEDLKQAFKALKVSIANGDLSNKLVVEEVLQN